MKFTPPRPFSPRLEGLTHERAPLTVRRSTVLLFAAVMFAAGFFIGACAFGTVLVHHTDAALRAQSLNHNQ